MQSNEYQLRKVGTHFHVLLIYLESFRGALEAGELNMYTYFASCVDLNYDLG